MYILVFGVADRPWMQKQCLATGTVAPRA